LRSSSIILIVGTVAIVAVWCARQLGTLHAPARPTQFVVRFVGYVIFAAVQQFLLQDYFLLRLLRAGLKPRRAAMTAAGIFALAHLPNPILTTLTFVWGLVATAWFLRNRSLYALAVSHMVLGITLAITVPGPTIRNMRVGLGYLTYRPPGSVHLSH
jgi:membrane protease YdiL (CAAX protease family)